MLSFGISYGCLPYLDKPALGSQAATNGRCRGCKRGSNLKYAWRRDCKARQVYIVIHDFDNYLCELHLSIRCPIALSTNSLLLQLPLSFTASIFGMNTKEFNDGHMTLQEEFTYICKHETLFIYYFCSFCSLW